MKQWTINIEETQKFLNEEYPENRYLIEPRGYQKNTWGEEFWIFVNDTLFVFIVFSLLKYLYTISRLNL